MTAAVFFSGGVVTKTPFNIEPSYSTEWFPSMPPMSGPGWPSAYAGIYERQLWVYVVVSKRARATARLPLPVYSRTVDESRVRRPDHPMFKLLTRPNPGLSGFNLWLWTSSTFDIYGDAFWLKRRNSSEVVAELWPMHPSSMTKVADDAWSFDNGKTRIDNIPSGDLVHFRSFHPTSMSHGMSPLEPLRATLENEWHARNATSSFWQRGARPGMALVHPQTLSDPALKRLDQKIRTMHSGSGTTGSTILLEEGLTPHNLTLTAEEAQYVETRKLNREEVCAAYDVPPPVVHILDRATFSNITEQMRSMYRDTMAPHLNGFEATIETDLRLAEWRNDDVYAEFLMDEVLRGDFEARQDALKNADHLTIAEKRRIENLPFIEGTDRIFINAAQVPLPPESEGDVPPPPLFQQVGLPALVDAGVISREDARLLLGIEGAPPPAPDPAFADVPRGLLGRLSWQKTLEQVDVAALVDGFPEHAGVVLAAYRAEKAANGTPQGLRARLSGKEPLTLSRDQEKVADVLRAFFARQGGIDRDSWDPVLTRDLHKVAMEVSLGVGRTVTRQLGFDPAEYDLDRTLAFLLAVAERYAVSVNDTTRKQLEGGDAGDVYAKAAESRAPGVAVAVAAVVSGFAATEAGRQAAQRHYIEPTKTWVTGHNARPTHAAMNGQTVGIDDQFSNGMSWPGEGDEDDIGCNCTIRIDGGSS